MNISTKYDIGEVVYVANSSGVTSQTVEAIKMTKKETLYRFPIKSSGYSMFFTFGTPSENWVKESDIFKNMAEAQPVIDAIAKRQEQEAMKQKAKDIAEKEKKLAHMQAELLALKSGTELPEPEDDDEDDDDI